MVPTYNLYASPKSHALLLYQYEQTNACKITFIQVVVSNSYSNMSFFNIFSVGCIRFCKFRALSGALVTRAFTKRAQWSVCCTRPPPICASVLSNVARWGPSFRGRSHYSYANNRHLLGTFG